MIIHPLSQVAIFALILSNVLAARLQGITDKNGYALYLMAGTLCWNLFSEIISRCLNLFIEQGNLLKKIRFPRIALPVIVIGSSLVNNVLLFTSILGIFALLGHLPTSQVLWVPLLMVGVVFLATGFGLILGVLNVFIRDIGQVVPVLLQILFWFTPIVYPLPTIPESYRHWIALNPIFPLVRAYQEVLVFDHAPDWMSLGPTALLGVLLSLLGLGLFRRASPELVDAV